MTYNRIEGYLEENKVSVLVSLVSALVLTGAFIGLDLDQLESPEDRKVAVIVLDGGDWKVVNQLIEQERIPHTEQMIKEGTAADFQAPEAFSPQSWTMMGSGMSAENLTIERNWSYETEEGMRRIDSSAIERRRFWSYLNEYGIETGIYSWLITWPVEPVDGFMISGHLAQNTETMSYPEVSELEVSEDTVINSMMGLDTYDAANKVLDEYKGMEVMTFGFVISDRMKHNYWKFLDKEKYPEAEEERELIYKNYEEVDELVGRLRSDGYTVILTSDHGFIDDPGEYDGDVNLFLNEIGLSEFEVDTEEERAKERNVDSDAAIFQLAHEKRVINETHYEFVLDHINKDVPPEEIKKELSKIYLTNGESFVPEVSYDDEESVFNAVMNFNRESMGENQVRDRHTHLSYARGEIPINDIPLYLEYEGQEYKEWIGPELSGNHPPGTDGIFIAEGDGVKQQGFSEDIEIGTKDLTPIMLYLKGVPIPEEMDGDVPEGIIETGYMDEYPKIYEDINTWRNATEVEEEDTSEEEQERIERRLAELGYLS